MSLAGVKDESRNKFRIWCARIREGERRHTSSLPARAQISGL
jgi:hypothetical protein